MALQQCPGTESFDTGQGRSVCEHEEEQLDLNVLDASVWYTNPTSVGNLGSSVTKGEEMRERKLLKNNLLPNSWVCARLASTITRKFITTVGSISTPCLNNSKKELGLY